VRITVNPEESGEFTLALRIPGWCRSAELMVNGTGVDVASHLDKGYVKLTRTWSPGDVVNLDLAMPVELVESHPAVAQNAGMVAIQRGPLVYCLEQADNNIPLHRIILPRDAEFKTSFDPNLLGGVVKITANVLVTDDSDWGDALYRPGKTATKPFTITAIPYYAWDNREPGEMRVWIRTC
jgi:DUF1680 family protein